MQNDEQGRGAGQVVAGHEPIDRRRVAVGQLQLLTPDRRPLPVGPWKRCVDGLQMAMFQPARGDKVTVNDHKRTLFTVGKKMAPCFHRGPAVELLLLQAAQQGAGERIPVALATLLHMWGHCQAVSRDLVDAHSRDTAQGLEGPISASPVPDFGQTRGVDIAGRILP